MPFKGGADAYPPPERVGRRPLCQLAITCVNQLHRTCFTLQALRQFEKNLKNPAQEVNTMTMHRLRPSTCGSHHQSSPKLQSAGLACQFFSHDSHLLRFSSETSRIVTRASGSLCQRQKLPNFLNRVSARRRPMHSWHLSNCPRRCILSVSCKVASPAHCAEGLAAV